jgi:diguanylate cyclase (GGDEF)-like protein
VDGERVGLVVLGWLPGGSRHPTRQERAALGGAGRYLAEALRRLELDARLRHLATHDPVTGLWNREGFRQRFAALRQSADASGRRLVVALVDLDEFRSLNDVFGHGAGDQVLRTVGRRLSRRVGPGGAAGRIGGDEFALAQILDTAQTPEAWLRRLLGATDRDIRFGSRRGHVGVSVGVAMMPDDGGDLESLFGRADRALYSVKRRGGHGGRRFEAAIER